MIPGDHEEQDMRSVALQNAASILAARQKADRELISAKGALEKKTQELAKSVARLRATLESTTDAIVALDADGKVTDYNERFLQFWNIDPEIMATCDRLQLRQIITRQLLTPEPFVRRAEEIQLSAPADTFDLVELADGRVFERHSRAQMDEGMDIGRVWSFRDVTAQRRAADELREQREWFKVTLSSIGDAVITTDLHSRVTFLNPIAETMTGWTMDEARGLQLADVFHIIHEETREKAENPVSIVLREGSIVALANHTSLISRGGVEIAIEDSAAPIRDSLGNITGAVMVFHDVTQRRRAEESLRGSEERLRALVHQAAVGIAVASLDGKFEEANQKFADLVGYSRDELRRLTFLDITFEDDRAKTKDLVKQLLSHQINEYAVEKRYIRKTGEPIWSLTTVTLLKDASGKPSHFVGIIEDITKRREAEMALKGHEAELRALADSISQLAWIADADGNIFWYNRKWYEYTGTTPAQMLGWGWKAVHDEALLPSVLERWQVALRSGEPFEMEFPLRSATGEFRWFLTRANPVRNQNGSTVRWFGTNTDVDQVKRAEDALREETRILELLNEAGTAIAGQLEMQGLLQTVTDAATTLSGAKFGAFFYTAKNDKDGAFMLYTLSGAPREAFEKFGHPRATPLFGPTFEGDAPVRCDDVLKDSRYGRMAPHHGMPKGHLPVRSYLAVPVKSRSGEVFGGLFIGHPEPGVFTARSERIVAGIAAQAAVAIDNARLYESAQKEIQERVQTEQKLRESEDRLRVSLETAALGTWELDVKVKTVALDERCQILFGTNGRDEISLDEFFAFGYSPDGDQRRAALEKLMNGTLDRYDIEFQIGTTWLRASAKPVTDFTGVVVSVIGAVFDISDLVKARATTEERRKELERLVEERTYSLKQAVGQMEEFSYSVSHDLRAPLRSIQTYAEVVIEDFGAMIGADGVEYLRRIVRAGSRMDQLTRDVLNYSKIARGNEPVVPVSLERVVTETVEQYAPAHLDPGAIVVEHPLLEVLATEPLLVQAISNLLANAIKFVADGVKPRIRIWTERRESAVRLWIEDNGIGIRPEHHDRIWAMFERVHPKGTFDGTGIGLAIVRKSVERMNGTVGVESDGSRGSRFWIQLPANSIG